MRLDSSLSQATAARLGPDSPQEQDGLRWWLPLQWSTDILRIAQAEGLITKYVLLKRNNMHAALLIVNKDCSKSLALDKNVGTQYYCYKAIFLLKWN
jgi:hypothetical protein